MQDVTAGRRRYNCTFHNQHVFSGPQQYPAVVVQGLSGSGKSSLLNALCGKILFPYFAQTSLGAKPSVVRTPLQEESSPAVGPVVQVFCKAKPPAIVRGRSLDEQSTTQQPLTWYEAKNLPEASVIRPPAPSPIPVVIHVMNDGEEEFDFMEDTERSTDNNLAISTSHVMYALETFHNTQWKKLPCGNECPQFVLIKDTTASPRITFVESQQLEDRPSMSLIKLLVFVVTENDVSGVGRSSSLSLLTSALNATHAGRRRSCRTVLLINMFDHAIIKKQEEDPPSDDSFELITLPTTTDACERSTPDKKIQELKAYVSRYWRFPEEDVFAFNVQKALAESLAPSSTRSAHLQQFYHLKGIIEQIDEEFGRFDAVHLSPSPSTTFSEISAPEE